MTRDEFRYELAGGLSVHAILQSTIRQTEEVGMSKVAGDNTFSRKNTITFGDVPRLQLCAWPDGASTTSYGQEKEQFEMPSMESMPFGWGEPGYQRRFKSDSRE